MRLGKEEIDAAARVIRSGELFKTMGTETADCESLLRGLFGAAYSILMTSGKAALISALTALGVGPGDEVIVPGYTYIATAIAVTAVGAIPVVAEIDGTMTLNAEDVKRKISRHTKAVIPVHIQGFPCDMDALGAPGVPLVEDACQADGGSYKGRRLGTIGAAGALSFNHFKIISAGEGGALLTNDRQLFERAMIFHDSSAIAYFGGQLDGMREPQFCGNEYRSNNIAAAILHAQLQKLDGILTDLRRNKKALMDALKNDFAFAPSHDPDGDCGTTLALRFESEAAARAFSEKAGGTVPIDTGKHVYTNWTPVMEKRGAFHPAMDPFKMPANRELNHNYSLDMCPNTLDYLRRTVYISVNPDWTQRELEAMTERIKSAK
jgi:dTDP-4-amino-4,6-dideoxygalactose transaminase